MSKNFASLPFRARFFFNLATRLANWKRFETAIRYYQKVQYLAPSYLETYKNLGNCYLWMDKIEEAESFYRKALALDPTYAYAYNNLGNVHKEKLELDAAIQCYEKALELDPEFSGAHWNYSLALLAKGDYLRGFAEYEWRFKDGHVVQPHHYTHPLWQGDSFVGKRLLVYCEQGFGDTIQYVRFLPLAKALGGTIVFETQEALYNLLKNVEGADETIARGSKLPNFDIQTSLMSLPYVLGISLDNLSDASYLKVTKSDKPGLSNLITQEDKKKIGLVWAGNPLHNNDRKRSCPLKHFEPLTSLSDSTLYSLQKQYLNLEDPELLDHWGVKDLQKNLNDFVNTAELISQLDHVISVDTAVAHLAGALGKPVSLILPYVPDWRWQHQVSYSPWYKNLKIFRQHLRGEWGPVLAEVCASLQNRP